MEFWNYVLWSDESKLTFWIHRSAVCLVQNKKIKKDKAYEQMNLHGQKWRWTSLVMWVFFCCRKCKSWLFDETWTLWILCSIRLFQQRLWCLQCRDQWMFQQDSHPNLLKLGSGIDIECSWVACSDLHLNENIWWDSRKAVATWKPKMIRSGSFCTRFLERSQKLARTRPIEATFHWRIKESS